MSGPDDKGPGDERLELEDEGSMAAYSSATGDPGGAGAERDDAATWTATLDPLRWEVRGELGLGGMGRVLLAHDRWLDRDIALKEPKSAGDIERLRREAAITARLEHPGVLPIYDVGRSPSGAPWFAMRLVRGTSLARLLRDEAAGPGRQRFVRPLLAVCETIAFAHERGIVHRDIKPANLMLGTFGETLVIDWGLAADTTAPGPLEQRGAIAGTARYMSPEQSAGELPDPRDDVFSLGVVLFEVLGGDEATIPVELVAIIRRATAPTRAERYPDAKALAADLASYLDGARVSAHVYGPAELLRRLVHAWRAPLVVTAIALVAIVVLSVLAVDRIRDERDAAEDNLAMALAAAAAEAMADDDHAEAEILATHSLARQPSPDNRGVLAQLPSERPAIEEVGALPCDPLDARGDALLCWSRGSLVLLRELRPVWRRAFAPGHVFGFLGDGEHFVAVNRLDVSVHASADGERVHGPLATPTFAPLVVGGDGSLTMTTPPRALRIRTDGLTAIAGAPCGPSGFSATALHVDGDRWAASCHDGSLVTGAFSRDEHRRIGATHVNRQMQVSALAFVGADVNHLLVGTSTGAVYSFDAESGEAALITAAEGLIQKMAVDENGRLAIVEPDSGAPIFIDVAARATLGRLPRAHGARVVVHEQPGVVLVAGHSLERWDFNGVRAPAMRLAGGVVTISLGPDGRHLFVAHGAHLSSVDTLERTIVGRRKWPGWLLKDVAPSPNGRELVAYGFGDPDLISLAIAPGLPELSRAPITWSVRRLAVLADGAVLRSTHTAGVKLHRVGAPHDKVGETILDESALDLVATPDGQHVGALGESMMVYRWDEAALAARPVLSRPCGRADGARAVAIAAGVDPVLAARDGEVVPVCGGDDEPVYRAPGARLTAVALSQRWVAAGARDGSVWIWRRHEPEVHLVARPHDARVAEVVIDLRERWIASGGWDDRVVFLDPLRATRGDPIAVERHYRIDLRDTMRRWSRSPFAAVVDGPPL